MGDADLHGVRYVVGCDGDGARGKVQAGSRGLSTLLDDAIGRAKGRPPHALTSSVCDRDVLEEVVAELDRAEEEGEQNDGDERELERRRAAVTANPASHAHPPSPQV